MREWIEIHENKMQNAMANVSLYMREWIEMIDRLKFAKDDLGLSLYERVD